MSLNLPWYGLNHTVWHIKYFFRIVFRFGQHIDKYQFFLTVYFFDFGCVFWIMYKPQTLHWSLHWSVQWSVKASMKTSMKTSLKTSRVHWSLQWRVKCSMKSSMKTSSLHSSMKFDPSMNSSLKTSLKTSLKWKN